MTLPPEYLRGIELFNRGEYFECHEVLEEIWLTAGGQEKDFLHALIQVAAALHHRQRGNDRGAASVYERAKRKLITLPPRMMRVNSAELLRQVDAFLASADNPSNDPATRQLVLPHIRFDDHS
ncbi:MAG TPA: DUF309 domain-containing protein [Blastocatellia bacterium]|nr:DUF309 domain-containing protein [Blastocatellia bacterium]